MRVSSWPLILVVASVLTLSAQTPRPSFAVVSVKAVRDQRLPRMPVVFPGGRFYRPGEASRDPVDVLVIESIRRPTEN